MQVTLVFSHYSPDPLFYIFILGDKLHIRIRVRGFLGIKNFVFTNSVTVCLSILLPKC